MLSCASLALFEFYFKFIGVFSQKNFYPEICIENKNGDFEPKIKPPYLVRGLRYSLEGTSFRCGGHSTSTTEFIDAATFTAIDIGFFTNEDLLFVFTPLAVLCQVRIGNG